MYAHCAASLSVTTILAVLFFTRLPVMLLQLTWHRRRARGAADRRHSVPRVAPQPAHPQPAQAAPRPVAHTLVKGLAHIDEAKSHMRALESQPVFSSFVRTEANFVKANRDPSLASPPACPKVRVALHAETGGDGLYTLWGVLNSRFGQRAGCRGLAFGFFSASCSTLIMVATFDNLQHGRTAQLLTLGIFMDQIVVMYEAFKFYPTFLIAGFLTYTVTRWRTLLAGCFGIQGRLKDIALHVGGALSRPEDPEARRFAWRVYRYLVTTHALCYAGTDGRLKGMVLEHELQRLGLLTADEWRLLQPVNYISRETVIAWLQADIEQAFDSGVLRSADGGVLLDSVRALRGAMAGFHNDRLDVNQPTAWVWLMTMLTYMLVFLAAVAFPAQEFENWAKLVTEPENAASLQLTQTQSVWCFHWWSLLQGFIYSTCYMCSIVMIDDLQHPFDVDIDSFNVDSTMIDSEATMFATLRSRFDERAGEPSVVVDGGK